jgi:tRNA U34 5-methylaminomethyl-2-thiouridine-forming methyltransferase MnmC
VSERYELVTLKNGVCSVRSLGDGETFHPVAGPVAEAESLYVRQLRLRERLAADEFNIWDVGLGAGGNVLTTLRALADIRGKVRIISFDQTIAALSFALQHAAQLEFPIGFETRIQNLINERKSQFAHDQLHVTWEVHLGDFPSLLASDERLPSPDAIFFDAFSPARNPRMWTLPLFENLFRRLDPQRPCALATFSRSTLARVTLLLAGFFVGIGEPVAGKEETTIAANNLDSIAQPLKKPWLQRARASHSAEPLRDNFYSRGALTSESWGRLCAHPQFAG